MASKAQRRRKFKRKKARATASRPLDVHARTILESMDATGKLMERLGEADDLVTQADAEFEQLLASVVTRVAQFDPVVLTEVARMAYLPWGPVGQPLSVAASTPAHVELLVLLALTAPKEAHGSDDDVAPPEPESLSEFVSHVKADLDLLLRLSQLLATARLDLDEQLSMISVLVRGSQVWVRNTSYPEVQARTVTDLVDGDPAVRQALLTGLGFGASEALAVLRICHDLQVENLNRRMAQMADAMNADFADQVLTDEGSSGEVNEASTKVGTDFAATLRAVFEPDRDAATVTVEQVAARTGLDASIVETVVDRFQLRVECSTPAEAIDSFMAGDNATRDTPLIVTETGRFMLPHDAHSAGAVRGNLEEYLKSAGEVWEVYAKHRGELLETRTSAALSRLLPGAQHWAGLEYYVPASSQEDTDADPDKYTKRVEGDHLAVVDDVAVIVEDKAVSFSALARGGKSTRLRSDLTGIITKAADQTGRLQRCIERDGGLRTHAHGWLDLSQVREIHTIAVSLDDLSSVTTATAELVKAGLLQVDNLPWTVSLHDLELITDLVDRPAEFLLYLRRRRAPEVTVMYSASDELDLFLHFFEAGLWVEPDPDQVRTAFPFLPVPTTAERRRYRDQQPTFITSRTDTLDAWYTSTRGPNAGAAPAAAKPTMVTSPLGDLIDELAHRRVEGWLSIGATLLSGSTGTQHQMAATPKELLRDPTSGRSMTVPITSETDPAAGWLLVWATRPVGTDPHQCERSLRDYLRAKKFQLNLPRGALLLYDEQSKQLADVYYDGHIGPLSQELSSRLSHLRAPEAVTKRLPPRAKRSSNRKRGSGRR